jgi:hypothetical protein
LPERYCDLDDAILTLQGIRGILRALESLPRVHRTSPVPVLYWLWLFCNGTAKNSAGNSQHFAVLCCRRTAEAQDFCGQGDVDG